jgi:hypothetical protein
LKNVVDKIAKVKVVVHHASATAVAVAQTSEIVTIEDHAAHAQNAATAHLAIVMPVAHVAQVATVAVLALAVQDHVNAAPSDLHVALRESMQSC